MNPIKILIAIVGMAIVSPTAFSDNAQQFTIGAGGGYNGRWSPDGQTIAFIRQLNNQPQIMLQPVAGGAATHFSTGLNGDHHMAWSPDGTELAFDARDGGAPDIWIIPRAGGTPHRITTEPWGQYTPAWCSAVNRILFTSEAGLWTIDPDGGNAFQVTTMTDIHYPAWSPDGSRIAYEQEVGGNWDIWIVSAQGGEPVRLTDAPGEDVNAAWSPDGQWIAYSSDREGQFDLWLMPAQGGTPRRVTDDPAADREPSWSPDQSKLSFTSQRGGVWNVWTIDSGLPPALPGWHDASAWKTFDPEDFGVGTRLRGYWGGAFDGRYIYFAPDHNGLRLHGKVLRYDTRGGGFENLAAWTWFNPGAQGVGTNPVGFRGAIFDGRYVYFIPSHSASSEVLRYDTQGVFNETASWAAFDLAAHNIGNIVGGYIGGTFDGRYVYFAPFWVGTYDYGEVLRYDTQGDFNATASWITFDPGAHGVGVDPDGYHGAAFDGRYVYFAPFHNGTGWHGEMLRYDTHVAFTSAAAWKTYDPGAAGVGQTPDGYTGVTFDGRYMYYTPFLSASVEHHGEVMRYDTTQPFAQATSWEAFDAGEHGVGYDPDGYVGGVFDGRYVYFAPDFNGTWFHGETLRYDTHAPFSDAHSWTIFNPAALALCSHEPSYSDVICDGRYVYFVPCHDEVQIGEVLRHDTAAGCLGDINRDGVVNLRDLAELLSNYGVPAPLHYADGDLDDDSDVDLRDLAALLGVYARGCP